MAGSDTLEGVEAGLGHDPDGLNTEYADPTPDPGRSLMLPVRREMPSRVTLMPPAR